MKYDLSSSSLDSIDPVVFALHRQCLFDCHLIRGQRRGGAIICKAENYGCFEEAEVCAFGE